MKRICIVLYFFCLIFTPNAFSEEIEINSEVMSVNPELDFFIIRAGEDKGIEIGDGLIVHRDAKKIATAYIIEVRLNVSAAEILEIEEGREILEGDAIVIVKETGEPSEEPLRISRVPERGPKPVKSKWARISTTLPVTETTTERQRGIAKKSQWKTLLGVTPEVSETPPSALTPQDMTSPDIVKEGDVVSVEINKDSKTVFSYALVVLKENGFSIISTNRNSGILLATRPMELSLLKELWADAIAAIDHNLVVSLEIKAEAGQSKLKLTSFKEHTQKDKYIKNAVTKKSRYYKELLILVSKIKERSEY